MKLYNTLTQNLETVTTDDGIFRMYVCGVTPYDTTHLGHAFTYVCFDVLARYLEYQGYRTITVENVTDIDDDILRRARKVGMVWDELARSETHKFLKDMKALNIRPTDHYPKATEEIPLILKMVQSLIKQGHAYEKNGCVYYDTRHGAEFDGNLWNPGYEELLRVANDRGNFPDDPNKKDPLDFVLWQAAQPDEPTWDSPWGPGRPGWHIECSAMSMHYLGPKIDIHSGGADLVFPHHSCEILQSEAYSGQKPFVRYWFHIAMVYLDGEKMSKSLGNMIFIRELIKTYSADAIRLYLLSHKYREIWGADDAEERLQDMTRLHRQFLLAVNAQSASSENSLDSEEFRKQFAAAMDDDLDTPEAIGVLTRFAAKINKASASGYNISAAKTAFNDLCAVLGLTLNADN